MIRPPATTVSTRRFATTLFVALALGCFCSTAPAHPNPLAAAIDHRAAELEEQVIEWRRDSPANPELSNRETRAAQKVAAHLRDLGISTGPGVSRTEIFGIP